MPALNFQKQFAALVEQGLKRQTIRAQRRHRIRVGQMLYLFTGMRTRHCRLLREAPCTRVRPITIHGATIRIDIHALTQSACESLARADGFHDLDAMLAWFEQTHHTDHEVFAGDIIEW